MPDRELLAGITLLLLDVDGVLTDGRVHFDGSGEEFKAFHVHDAAGIVYWHRCGGMSGFLSGRGGKVVEMRARELGVHEVHLRKLEKAEAFAEILERRRLTAEQVAYVGDDLLDLPVLRQAGFAATVPEGRPEVRQECHYVTVAPCGSGAVREVVEILLRAKDLWSTVVEKGGRP